MDRKSKALHTLNFFFPIKNPNQHNTKNHKAAENAELG